MIGSMNIGVTIGAAAVEILDGAQRLGLRWMTAGVVAGIADAGHADLQQLGIVGAVRFVAVGAVFNDRWVLPQERAAALGVAAQTVLVGSALYQLLGIRASVGIVAAGAGDFAFPVRHVRGALQLRAAHLVALQAELRLVFLYAAIFRERRAVARVGGDFNAHVLLDLMAIDTRHAARLMWAAAPEHV